MFIKYQVAFPYPITFDLIPRASESKTGEKKSSFFIFLFDLLQVHQVNLVTLPEQVDSSASTSAEACHWAAEPTELARSEKG